MIEIKRDLYKERVEGIISEHLQEINQDNQELEGIELRIEMDKVFVHNYKQEKDVVLLLDNEFIVNKEWEHYNGASAIIIYYLLEKQFYKIYFFYATGYGSKTLE